MQVMLPGGPDRNSLADPMAKRPAPIVGISSRAKAKTRNLHMEEQNEPFFNRQFWRMTLIAAFSQIIVL